MRPTVRWWDLAALAAAAVVSAAAAVAALRDQASLALAAVGLALLCAVAGLVGLGRRLDLQQRALAQSGDRLERALARSGDRLERALADSGERLERAIGEIRDDLVRAAGEPRDRLEHQVARHEGDQVQQVEALVQLFAQVQPRAPMPSSGRWALNPTELLEVWHLIERVQPDLVLELGSGTSTVWLGYALAARGGRLVSVEHDPVFAEQTRAHLRRHDLSQIVAVRDAPLVEVTVDGQQFRWYDQAVFADVTGVDVLLVDGPPGNTGPLARLPALPLLAPRLAATATVVLDDAERDDERQVLARWSQLHPQLTREPGTLGQLAVLAV